MELAGFSWFGLAGSLVMLVGVLASILGFSGMKKEPYSLLNHFISELGDPRFAKHKTMFAITMITSGILMIPFTIGFALHVGSIMTGLLIGIGIFCSISCALVGLFPENKIKAHFIVAGCFFVGMAVLILMFCISIVIQPTPVFPLWILVPSCGSLAVTMSFLIDTVKLEKWELDRTAVPWDWENGRPRFWRNPFLEWCAYFALMAWLFTIVFFSF